MDLKAKLVELQLQADLTDEVSENTTQHREFVADLMVANGVTVQEWIPASEPPKEKGRYWCNVKSFAFPGSYYQTVLKWDGGFIEGGVYTDDVTHWMPLPLPPKGD